LVDKDNYVVLLENELKQVKELIKPQVQQANEGNHQKQLQVSEVADQVNKVQHSFMKSEELILRSFPTHTFIHFFFFFFFFCFSFMSKSKRWRRKSTASQNCRSWHMDCRKHTMRRSKKARMKLQRKSVGWKTL
jgi:hypothetical protein